MIRAGRRAAMMARPRGGLAPAALGRLEPPAVLVLFTPHFWRK